MLAPNWLWLLIGVVVGVVVGVVFGVVVGPPTYFLDFLPRRRRAGASAGAQASKTAKAAGSTGADTARDVTRNAIRRVACVAARPTRGTDTVRARVWSCSMGLWGWQWP